MNRLIDGTQYRECECGIVVVRGKRTLYLLATSVVGAERARHLLASHSFHRLFCAGKPHPVSRNTRYIKIAQQVAA